MHWSKQKEPLREEWFMPRKPMQESEGVCTVYLMPDRVEQSELGVEGVAEAFFSPPPGSFTSFLFSLPSSFNIVCFPSLPYLPTITIGHAKDLWLFSRTWLLVFLIKSIWPRSMTPEWKLWKHLGEGISQMYFRFMVSGSETPLEGGAKPLNKTEELSVTFVLNHPKELKVTAGDIH